jgi:hypothetical protein
MSRAYGMMKEVTKMKITITKTTNGYEAEDTKINYDQADWEAWKNKYGLYNWEQVPDTLNLRGCHGAVTVSEIIELSDVELQALKQEAQRRTKTEVRVMEI